MYEQGISGDEGEEEDGGEWGQNKSGSRGC